MFDDIDEEEERRNSRNSSIPSEVLVIDDVIPPVITERRRAIDMTSYFQSNKKVKPNYSTSKIIVENKQYSVLEAKKVADEIITPLKHKLGRDRSVMVKRKEFVISKDSINSVGDDHEIQELSQNSSSSIVQDSIASKDTSTTITKSTETGMIRRIEVNKKSSVPLMDTQRDRIKMVAAYDRGHTTRHADILQATRTGIFCTVCSNSLRDPSQLFRLNEDGSLNSTCHIASRKHTEAMAHAYETQQRQQSLAHLLSRVTPKVPRKVVNFRFQLTQLLLRFDIPFAATNEEFFKQFVDEFIGSSVNYMTDRSNLSKEYIPLVNEKLKADGDLHFKDGPSFCIIVDSTRLVGEWYGFIIRTVTETLEVIHVPKLLRLAKCLSEKGTMELTALMTNVAYEIIGLCKSSNYLPKQFVSISGDRVSLNRCSFTSANMKKIFPYTEFVDCHSHTFANCGKAIEDICKHQNEFWQLHNAVFSRGESAKFQWLSFTGESMIDYSDVRWFGKRDAKEWVRKRFNQYTKFFSQQIFDKKDSTTSIYKMRQMICPEYWTNDIDSRKLQLFKIKLELAILCDASKIYYINGYRLEGDGPLCPFVYDIINDVALYLETHTLNDYPNVAEIIDDAVSSLPNHFTREQKKAERDKWTEFSFARINKSRDYFNSHFLATSEQRAPSTSDNNFGHLICMWKSFALLDPRHLRRLSFSFSDNDDGLCSEVEKRLDLLHNMFIIDEQMKTSCLTTLRRYLNASKTFEYAVDALLHAKLNRFKEFWMEFKNELNPWFSLVKKSLLYHPNSCAVERLFSVLKRVLTTEKESSLDDYIEASVYLKYRALTDEKRLVEEEKLLG